MTRGLERKLNELDKRMHAMARQVHGSSLSSAHVSAGVDQILHALKGIGTFTELPAGLLRHERGNAKVVASNPVSSPLIAPLPPLKKPTAPSFVMASRHTSSSAARNTESESGGDAQLHQASAGTAPSAATSGTVAAVIDSSSGLPHRVPPALPAPGTIAVGAPLISFAVGRHPPTQGYPAGGARQSATPS